MVSVSKRCTPPLETIPFNIESSYFLGVVSGVSYIGGIAGSIIRSGDSEVSKCFSNGVVKGRVKVGGIVGYAGEPYGNYYSFIRNCYSRSYICNYNNGMLSYQYVGGIIGQGESAILKNCYTTSFINVNGTEIGGLSGDVYNAEWTHDSFWSPELSGLDYSASGTSVTASQLLNQTTFTDAEWYFSEIWYIDPELNNGYPILRNIMFTENIDEEVNNEIEAPTSMKLAYPNPFNPETTIEFFVKRHDKATLTIYNVKGQVVKSYGSYQSGEHRVVWNGVNNDNKKVSSGLYLYRLEDGLDSSYTNKMILMK